MSRFIKDHGGDVLIVILLLVNIFVGLFYGLVLFLLSVVISVIIMVVIVFKFYNSFYEKVGPLTFLLWSFVFNFVVGFLIVGLVSQFGVSDPIKTYKKYSVVFLDHGKIVLEPMGSNPNNPKDSDIVIIDNEKLYYECLAKKCESFSRVETSYYNKYFTDDLLPQPQYEYRVAE